ncbi:phosphoserine phosphatase SerB [Beggiatoa leptomitoformis]|uniref:Phosphoserine phosphatase n=1 Tax=Beggiatoa leptomitoformis TaxID=288004 RepID=A0A2N9YAT0_9GAMM|nr:phosphoserine phosphatase SerB [Beggiatoa leptomitoformis]ALG67035.1 phosphoserine phosphatase SerB [Beggiatoa leptomitoformis]AUI67587.1 phosphoserine phosphatase SerB [Beggiatoa leptomitoformis]
MKLCVFDFDSTLMDGETIDEIAAACGKKNAVAHITEQAMQGKLDFFEALTQRVAMLAGTSYTKVIDVCQHLPLMNGALETVQGLQQQGYKVVILSGGFHEATAYLGKQLGVDGEFANFLHHKENVLTGKVGGEMMQSTSKGDMLARLQKLLGAEKANTIVVGDGANDASMFPYADKKVAFCAKPILKQQANIIIDHKDLRELLQHI